jgi:hypothetical protein
MAKDSPSLHKTEKFTQYFSSYRRITGSVTAAIVLQQISMWSASENEQPFYKFFQPCAHAMYRKGDSWSEELAFSYDEMAGALKKIATKITQAEFNAGIASEKKPNHLVFYWTTLDRVTWYYLNRDLLDTYLRDDNPCEKGTSRKQEKPNYHDLNGNTPFTTTGKASLHDNKETENTKTENTKEYISPSFHSGDLPSDFSDKRGEKDTTQIPLEEMKEMLTIIEESDVLPNSQSFSLASETKTNVPVSSPPESTRIDGLCNTSQGTQDDDELILPPITKSHLAKQRQKVIKERGKKLPLRSAEGWKALDQAVKAVCFPNTPDEDIQWSIIRKRINELPESVTPEKILRVLDWAKATWDHMANVESVSIHKLVEHYMSAQGWKGARGTVRPSHGAPSASTGHMGGRTKADLDALFAQCPGPGWYVDQRTMSWKEKTYAKNFDEGEELPEMMI